MNTHKKNEKKKRLYGHDCLRLMVFLVYYHYYYYYILYREWVQRHGLQEFICFSKELESAGRGQRGLSVFALDCFDCTAYCTQASRTVQRGGGHLVRDNAEFGSGKFLHSLQLRLIVS